MKPMLLPSLCALVACLWLAPAAQAQSDLVLGVSEGSSGGLDHARVVAKYGGLAELIGRALKRKVQVVFAREFKALEEGYQSGRFDLMLARPSDFPARAMRDYGYHYVASAKPDGQCLVITGKDSPLTSLANAKGKRWVMPEQVSYMAKFCAAELRDHGIVVADERVQYVREQGAVPFYIDNAFSDIGVVASYSGVAKNLPKTGHKLLHKSVTQPYFPLVAHKKFTPEQVRAMQAELLSLQDTEAGREVLKAIGIQGFDTSSGERLKALPGWLGL